MLFDKSRSITTAIPTPDLTDLQRSFPGGQHYQSVCFSHSLIKLGGLVLVIDASCRRAVLTFRPVPDFDFRSWYATRRSQYEQLADVARTTLTRLLQARGLEVVSVTARAKEIDHAVEKVDRKGYSDPQAQLTDLAGVRIIVFVESDLPKVSDIVREAFHVIPEKSGDKTVDLGVDRAGYRSIHLVCDLGEDRTNLPEFAVFCDLVFEVQVRTAFQHAWAEVEHNRRYKFGGVLPTQLQRRLYLLAGMLEIADRELASIAADVDDYAESVAQATRAGDLDVEINSTSVAAYLEHRLSALSHLELLDLPAEQLRPEVIEELRGFGLSTLADLDSLFATEFIEAVRKCQTTNSRIGLLRDVMMYTDLERYFRDVWQNHWQGTDEESIATLATKYGDAVVRKCLNERKIDINLSSY